MAASSCAGSAQGVPGAQAQQGSSVSESQTPAGLEGQQVVFSPRGRTARVSANRIGRDFVVGDVHGYFSALRLLLENVEFERGRDRLFSVGDLIDRGPQSAEALHWLESGDIALCAMGNHEEMMLAAMTAPEDSDAHAYRELSAGKRVDLWYMNGGSWWEDATREASDVETEALVSRWRVQLHRLPYAITLDTPHGALGIVHSCPLKKNWNEFVALMENGTDNARTRAVWTRMRSYGRRESVVDNVPGEAGEALWDGVFTGVRLVLAGHSPVKKVAWDRNLLNLDAGVYRHKQLALAEVSSAQIGVTLLNLRKRTVNPVDVPDGPGADEPSPYPAHRQGET